MDRKKFEQKKVKYYKLKKRDIETGVVREAALTAFGLEGFVNEHGHYTFASAYPRNDSYTSR